MYNDYDFIDISYYLDDADILDAKTHALDLFHYLSNSTRPLSNNFLRDLFLSRASEIAVMRFFESKDFIVKDNKKTGEGNEFDFSFIHNNKEFKVDVKSKWTKVNIDRNININSINYNIPLTRNEIKNGKLIQGEVEKFLEGKFDYLVAVSTYYNSMNDFKLFLLGSLNRFEFSMKYYNNYYEEVSVGQNISVSNNNFNQPVKVNSLNVKFKDLKPFEEQFITLTEQYYF